MTTPESPLTIRAASEGDGPAITGLFSQVFHKEMSPEQWAWKYRMPLHHQVFAAVATDGEGGIIGHVGAVPLIGVRRGQDMPAWQLVDAMVASGFRGKDIFRGLLRHVGRSIESISSQAVIYAFAGPDSTKIGLKKGILADKARVSCYLLKTPAVTSPGFGWSLEPVSFVDSRLATLWRRRAGDLTAFTQRDGDYLTWRYALNPFHRYSVAVVRHLYRSVGWLIWRQDDDGIKLVDYCVKASHFGPAVALLARYAAPEQIRFWGPDPLIAAARLPLTVEETPVCLMLLNTGDEKQIPRGMGEDYLYTMGDADIY